MELGALKRAVSEAAGAFEAEATKAADRVWEYAEEALHEFRSSRLLRETLAAHGFRPERELRALPTAFVMSAGSGRPRIGILAEYDALPDCGLEEGACGHGCGHHLLGAGSVLGALTAWSVMQRRRRPRGTVVVFGCPAEETLTGKLYMAREGAFADVDAVVAWHPGHENRVHLGGGAALNAYTFEFFGKTAHGSGADKGRSALDGVELMDHAVNILREHVPEQVRMHGVIRAGGRAPNVVPEYARSWYYVRAKDRKEVEEVSERVMKCARGAALATETTVKRTLLTGCYERLRNEAFAEHADRCLRRMGPPAFDKSDDRVVRRMGIKEKLEREVKEIDKTAHRGSSDDDTVSWLAPLISFGMACYPPKVTGHHRDMTALGRKSFAHKGMAQAGRLMALIALSLMADGNARGRIRREFRRRTKEFTFDPLVPRGRRPPVRDGIPAAPPRPEE